MTITKKYVNILFNVPIAQSVEQLPFKQMVAGSNPAGDTTLSKQKHKSPSGAFVFLWNYLIFRKVLVLIYLTSSD